MCGGIGRHVKHDRRKTDVFKNKRAPCRHVLMGRMRGANPRHMHIEDSKDGIKGHVIVRQVKPD